MMPTMSSIMLECITDARNSSSTITAREPIRAPSTTAMLPPAPATVPPAISMTIATPREAPFVMPRMEGPARGLRKDVWSNNPLTASDAPQRIAVMACGSRDSSTMKRHDSFSASPPVMIVHTSAAGMLTEPKSRLPTNSSNREHRRKKMAFFIDFIEDATASLLL